MADFKFGLIGKLTKKQDPNRYHFSEMPIGTEFLVLQSMGLDKFDVLVYFFGYPPQIDQNGRENYIGLVEKGSYVITGSIKYIYKDNLNY